MNNNLKTAFILSIVADTFIDALAICLYFSSALFSSVSINSDNISFWISVIAIAFITPIVLGAVSLYLLKSVGEVQRKERVFVILTRVFSLISIIGSAVLLVASISLVGFIVALFRNY